MLRRLVLLSAVTALVLSAAACSSDGDDEAGGDDPTTTSAAEGGDPTTTSPDDGDDDGDGAGGGADGDDGDVVVLDGTTYAVMSVSCSLDQFVEGDAAVNADLEGGGEARLAYSPDLEDDFHELEIRVDDETWSLFSGDSHDTLTVSVEGTVVDASAEVGAFAGGQGGGELVEASLRVTCP